MITETFAPPPPPRPHFSTEDVQKVRNQPLRSSGSNVSDVNIVERLWALISTKFGVDRFSQLCELAVNLPAKISQSWIIAFG